MQFGNWQVSNLAIGRWAIWRFYLFLQFGNLKIGQFGNWAIWQSLWFLYLFFSKKKLNVFLFLCFLYFLCFFVFWCFIFFCGFWLNFVFLVLFFIFKIFILFYFSLSLLIVLSYRVSPMMQMAKNKKSNVWFFLWFLL